MFATDSVKNQLDNDPPLGECIECERQLLETRYFSCFGSDQLMSGLSLPRSALEDIYYRTAQKVYGVGRAISLPRPP